MKSKDPQQSGSKEAAPVPESRYSTLACDVVTALAFAFAWAAFVAWRLGSGVSRLHVFVAVLGCGAATLAPLLAALRGARPLSPAVQTLLAGGLLSAGPLAVFGSLLGEKTHHRALGAVTYAFVALAIVAICSAVARRLLSPGAETAQNGSPRLRRVARAALGVAAALSVMSLVVPLRTAFAQAVSGGGSEPIADGLTLAVLVGAGLSIPRWPLSPAEARRAVAAFAVALAMGGFVVGRDARVRETLLARAPVALGAGRLFGS